MNDSTLEQVPAASREAARAALAAAFGRSAALELRPLAGGASGALVYRVDVAGRPYLLRLETHKHPWRNPRQYACLRTAADAGVAPRVVHLDDAAGALVMDFVQQRPLSEFPGGPAALARAAGGLAARLQATARFPALHDYQGLLQKLFAWLRGSGLFEAALLEPHREAFERIREAYPWSAAEPVSSHNDPNPQNLLFDGERLWLVDWETAYLNDPLTDVAILSDHLARTPELERALVEAWLGRPPDRALSARLYLMRQLTRFYYAALLLSIAALRSPPAAPARDLDAPTPAEFSAAVAAGNLDARNPEALHALGRMLLA
ncbi:MAG TPA: phosphotransferase, partial [Gammaproteobacteria bacterium]|nr:phosphotransferase [Gammaproteobacteria bacterium]